MASEGATGGREGKRARRSPGAPDDDERVRAPGERCLRGAGAEIQSADEQLRAALHSGRQFCRAG